MDTLFLPFLPNSVTEQWMLARDADEISMVLEEIIDQYKGCTAAMRSKISDRDMLSLIQQVLGKLNFHDDTLRLNGLRLLRAIAEDSAKLFLEVSYLIYTKLQTFLQDPSRLIRTSSLSLAAALSAGIPLYNVADNILSIVESKPPYREYCLKVAAVSVLGLVRQCHSKKEQISDSHIRLLRAYVVRLANCAAVEFIGGGDSNSGKGGSGSGEDTMSINHAAMDLLAIASLAISELQCLVNKDTSNGAYTTPQPALRNLLSSISALQTVGFELDNNIEREVCRRMKSLDFPSLADEATYGVVKALLSKVKPKAPPAESSASGKARSAAGINIPAVSAAPSADSLEGETTPRTYSEKHVARRTASMRKSWSASVETNPGPGAWGDGAPDTAPAAYPGSAKFSPPKLIATQSQSFKGSPSQGVARSSSQKSDAAFGATGASSAATERVAARPSRKSFERKAEHQHSYSADLDGAAEEASFRGSMHSHSGSANSAQSFTSAGDSYRDHRVTASLSGLKIDTSRSSSANVFDEAATPSTSAPTNEYMGKSLRLLKSPYGGRVRSDSAQAQAAPMSPVASSAHTRGGFADSDNIAQSSEWVHSASSDSFSQYSQYSQYGRVSGARGVSFDAADSDAEFSASASRSNAPVTQAFDSASKSRLKRSRLKSANAAISNMEEGVAVEDTSNDSSFHLSGKSNNVQPRIPTGRGLASMSDTGLDRHLVPGDDRPIGGQRSLGQGQYLSNDDLQAMGAFDSSQNSAIIHEASPSPLKKPGRRSKLSANSASNDVVPLNLNEVTSLITKPDTTYDYTASEDLKPLSSPAQEFNKAYKGLEVQEWPDIFHTLTVFRRLALHHPAVLVNSGVLHNTIVLVMKRVDELRSQLAKNAILTVEDLVRGLGRNMDPEIATFLPGILKRSTDSSTFLAESADNVLQRVIENISVGRSVPALLLHIAHRSPALRAKIAVCLHAITHCRGEELNACKDFDSLKSGLSKLIHDSSSESRAYSREVVRLFVFRNIASRGELEAHIAADLLEKILHETAGQVLSVTVSNRSIAAPGSADYSTGAVASSPMRSVGKPARAGRNVSAGRAGAGAAGVPFSPAVERPVESQFGNEWSGGDFGCASADATTPTRVRERAPRNTPGRMHATPNKGRNGRPPSDGASDAESDLHDLGRLRASSEQLSAQLDAHLSSPHPNREANMKASGSIGSKGTNTGATTSSSGSAAASNAVASAAKRAIEQDPQLSCLQDILASTAVSSWAARKDAVDTVTDMMIRCYDVLRDGNKLSACVDCLLARLEDGNVKVQMHTISCLEKINEEEPLILQHNLMQIVVPAVLGSAASTNKLIAGKSVQMLRLLFDTVSPAQVAAYLCQTALHEKDKLRLTALKFLADVMPVFCADHDSIVSIAKKIIFPMLVKLLFTSSTKADLRVCAAENIRAMQTSLRTDKLWLWADDPPQQEELKRLTSTA